MPDPVRPIISPSRAVTAFGPDGLTELLTRSRTANSLDGGVTTRALEALASLRR